MKKNKNVVLYREEILYRCYRSHYSTSFEIYCFSPSTIQMQASSIVIEICK